MESKEIVNRLICGSAEIDRMRREIDLVVSMVLGLIPPETRKALRGRGCEFPDGRGIWNTQPSDDGKSIFVVCWIRPDPRYSEKDWFDSYMAWNNWPEPGNVRLDTKDVQLVYNRLPILIEGLMRWCPGLEEKMKPFLEATEGRRAFLKNSQPAGRWAQMKLYVRWNVDGEEEDRVDLVNTESGATALSWNFHHNRERLYGFCRGVIESLNTFFLLTNPTGDNPQIKMPVCLEGHVTFDTKRED